MTVAIGFLFGSRVVERHLIIMVALWMLFAFGLGRLLQTRDDPWLPGLISLAMLAKLVMSWFRYFVLIVFYGGSGDALRYNRFGGEIAEIWRAFEVPDVSVVGYGGEGTRFTAWVTGLLYAPYEPSLLGGFWIFALLAFIGQLFLYLAFRKTVESSKWKRFGILIFFWPTLLYWPSSIGKEALILLFLGLTAWAGASLYRHYNLRWIPIIVFSVFVIGMVRIHVAALVAGSLLAGLVLARGLQGGKPAFKRLLLVVAGIALIIPVVLGVSEEFGVDLATASAEDLDPAFSSVANRTQKGGSSVKGGIIEGPADIPAGVTKVLFRPLPFEADNLPMLAASLEGLMLLGLIAWRTPTMLRGLPDIRKSAYLMFCLVYTSLFVWAWSSILNLGIIARQRSLVLPFILALIAALGWESSKRNKTDRDPMKGKTKESLSVSIGSASTHHSTEYQSSYIERVRQGPS